MPGSFRWKEPSAVAAAEWPGLGRDRLHELYAGFLRAAAPSRRLHVRNLSIGINVSPVALNAAVQGCRLPVGAILWLAAQPKAGERPDLVLRVGCSLTWSAVVCALLSAFEILTIESARGLADHAGYEQD